MDSRNDGAIGSDDDPVEDDPSLPGKAVLANTVDSTANNVPDFADGIDRHGNSGPGRSLPFVPCELSVPAFLDLSKAKLSITYDAADPAAVTVAGSPPSYSPGSANPIRLWRLDGPCDRKVASVLAGGDYIPPGEYTANQVLGASGGASLYIEGVNRTDPQTTRILVRLDPDGSSGYICDDAVRCTVATLDLDFRDITGADWPAGSGGANVPRIPSSTEAQGAACDRLVGGNDGGALLLVRVLASPLLYSATAPPVTVGLGYIDAGAFSPLPGGALREGSLADLTPAEQSFLGSLGLQKAGEQLPDGRWVLKAQKYRPPAEMDVNDTGNKEKERHVPLALDATGWVNAHGSRPYYISLVRAPLVLVHGIDSSYTECFVDSGWTDKFQNEFGFVCHGANHETSHNGNGDIHLVYAAVAAAVREAVDKMENGQSFQSRPIACQKADIVAHSYGGLLSRWYTEESGDYGTRRDVRKLITMGTPHRGAVVCNIMSGVLKRQFLYDAETGGGVPTPTLSLGEVLDHLNDRWLGILVRWHTVASGPGTDADIVPSLQVMSFPSAVLAQLNTDPFDPEIAYAAIIGTDATLGPGFGDAHVFMEPHDGNSSPDVSYFPWLSLLDGATGGSQSDAIVPVWSQTLPAASAPISVKHTGYTDNTAVREQVRAWLNDPVLPRGAVHRSAFVGAVVANDISRRNAYVGSRMPPGSADSRGADIREEAIVRVLPEITASHPEADLAYDPAAERYILGPRGGLVTFRCTGMVRYGNTGTLAATTHQTTVLQANVPITVVTGAPVAGPPFVQASGQLIPFTAAAGRIGRTLHAGIIGPDGQDSNWISGASWKVGYALSAPLSIDSPPAAIYYPAYVLPPPEGVSPVPPLPGNPFAVRGGVPCAGAPGTSQAVHVHLVDDDPLFDVTLVDAIIGTTVPAGAFADVLIPYEYASLGLFSDADGHVAGGADTSGECSTQVYQELVIPGWTPNPDSTRITVDVAP